MDETILIELGIDNGKNSAYKVITDSGLKIQKRMYNKIVKNLSSVVKVKVSNEYIVIESYYAHAKIPKSNPNDWTFRAGEYNDSQLSEIA